jgi:3-hydroxybutyryl-CoA dehydrogenase
VAQQETNSLKSIGLSHVADQSGSGAISRVAVVGGGIMGQGLAQTIAQTGVEVILIERDDEGVKRAMGGLSDSLDHEINRWGMTASERRAILARIKTSADLRTAALAPLVVEAIHEVLSDKVTLFAKLDTICPEQTILATNTASLSITEIATGTQRPDRVIGMHFLNPVPKIPLVELVRGLGTSDETLERAKGFVEKQLGKTAVEVFEYPGGITTRVIVALLNEAMYCLMDGVASAEGIDAAIRLGYNFPIGPLALADQIGLDTVQAWMESLSRELGDQKYRPCPLLRKLVRGGHLGKKTSRGIFLYDAQGERLPGANVSPLATAR